MFTLQWAYCADAVSVFSVYCGYIFNKIKIILCVCVSSVSMQTISHWVPFSLCVRTIPFANFNRNSHCRSFILSFIHFPTDSICLINFQAIKMALSSFCSLPLFFFQSLNTPQLNVHTFQFIVSVVAYVSFFIHLNFRFLRVAARLTHYNWVHKYFTHTHIHIHKIERRNRNCEPRAQTYIHT